jgi:hypothetical protein
VSVPHRPAVGGHGVVAISWLPRPVENRARHNWKLAKSNASRLALTSCILLFFLWTPGYGEKPTNHPVGRLTLERTSLPMAGDSHSLA